MSHHQITGVLVIPPAIASDYATVMFPDGTWVPVAMESLLGGDDEEHVLANLGVAFRLSGLQDPATDEFISLINSSAPPGRDGFELGGGKMYIVGIYPNNATEYNVQLSTTSNGPVAMEICGVSADALKTMPPDDERKMCVIRNIRPFLRKNGVKAINNGVINSIRAAKFWY